MTSPDEPAELAAVEAALSMANNIAGRACYCGKCGESAIGVLTALCAEVRRLRAEVAALRKGTT